MMQDLVLRTPIPPFLAAGKCLSTIKEDDQFYALDYRRDGSIFAATGKNHTVSHTKRSPVAQGSVGGWAAR